MLTTISCNNNQITKHQIKIDCKKFPMNSLGGFSSSSLSKLISLLLCFGIVFLIIINLILLLGILFKEDDSPANSKKSIIAHNIIYYFPLLLNSLIILPMLKDYLVALYQVGRYSSDPKEFEFLLHNTSKDKEWQFMGADIIIIKRIFNLSQENIKDINATSTSIYLPIYHEGRVIDVTNHQEHEEVLQIEFIGKNTDHINNTMASWKALHKSKPAPIIFNFLAALIVCGILVIFNSMVMTSSAKPILVEWLELFHQTEKIVGPVGSNVAGMVFVFQCFSFMVLLLSIIVAPLLTIWIKQNLYHNMELRKLRSMICAVRATQKMHIKKQFGLPVQIISVQ